MWRNKSEIPQRMRRERITNEKLKRRLILVINNREKIGRINSYRGFRKLESSTRNRFHDVITWPECLNPCVWLLTSIPIYSSYKASDLRAPLLLQPARLLCYSSRMCLEATEYVNRMSIRRDSTFLRSIWYYYNTRAKWCCNLMSTTIEHRSMLCGWSPAKFRADITGISDLLIVLFDWWKIFIVEKCFRKFCHVSWIMILIRQFLYSWKNFWGFKGKIMEIVTSW